MSASEGFSVAFSLAPSVVMLFNTIVIYRLKLTSCSWFSSLFFFLQVDDNIPLRVMLLLMDEVFDLKERNQWLRRNIKNLLQQLIRATYGDTINR